MLSDVAQHSGFSPATGEISKQQALCEPFFLPVEGKSPGQRYCVYHPAQGGEARGAILYVHPFAEEMNKSRRMAALQSRTFAQAGYAVLQIDLLGCGDSSGDFGDATWDEWVADVQRASEWLVSRIQAPLWFWGLRVGCLIAVKAAAQMMNRPNFLFWAPTVSGKQALQQFLRLKVAAEITIRNAKEVLDELRSKLAQGHCVEIAGYQMSSALAKGLESTQLDPLDMMNPMGRLEWLELSTRQGAEISPVGVQTLAKWQHCGWTTSRGQVATGPAFWQTTEIEDAPDLIQLTTAALHEPVHA